MKFKFIKKIIIGFVAIAAVGGSLFAYEKYDNNKPLNVYQKAYDKTSMENKAKILNIYNENDNEETFVEYSIDKKKDIIELTKDTEKLIIKEDKYYYKVEDNLYLDLVSEVEIKDFIGNIQSRLEGHSESYLLFQDNLKNNFDKENIKVENVNKTINSKDIPLTQLTFTIYEDKAKEILKEYLLDEFEEYMMLFVSDISISNTELSDLEKEEFEKELLETSIAKMKTDIETMKFSDITFKIGIDENGYIREREEEYSITLNGVLNTSKNKTVYLAFGDDVIITDLDKIDTITKEDYYENKKEVKKEELKRFIESNPEEEELDLSDLSEIESQNTENDNMNIE